jgi:hypothetical protein
VNRDELLRLYRSNDLFTYRYDGYLWLDAFLFKELLMYRAVKSDALIRLRALGSCPYEIISLVSNYNRICDNIDFYEDILIEELLGLS